MLTSFAPEQLEDPATAQSEAIIRKCVHCGFCTATCPTYVLLGDELDSPRGRIYLIKDMLENGRTPDAELVTHVDRCLSCLSCMTTCPSGVNYMHLVDHARAYIHERYRRPWPDRMYRALLAAVLPHRARFAAAMRLALLGKPLRPLFARFALTRPLAAMLALAQPSPARRERAPRAPASGALRGRVLMLRGCAEPVLRPQYHAATARVLGRLGYAVEFAYGEGCCGALVHHMGREHAALANARRNVDAWTREIDRGDVAAIITTASGCGTVLKNYGHMLRDDPAYAERARRCSLLAKDVSELLKGDDLTAIVRPAERLRGVRVAYQPACSLQHGQGLGEDAKRLLERAGFVTRIPFEAHLCCGSAGTYNILQPELAGQLAARKVANLAALDVDVVATSNVGCAVQIGKAGALPVVHTIELLDWATGGEPPAELDPVLEGRPA